MLVDCYIASYTPLNLVQDDEDLSWHYEDVVDSTKPTIDQLVQCLTAYSEDRSPSMPPYGHAQLKSLEEPLF